MRRPPSAQNNTDRCQPHPAPDQAHRRSVRCSRTRGRDRTAVDRVALTLYVGGRRWVRRQTGGACTVLESTVSQGFAEIHCDSDLVVARTQLVPVTNGFDVEVHGDDLTTERDLRLEDLSSHAARAPEPSDESLELLGFAGDVAAVDRPSRWIAVVVEESSSRPTRYRSPGFHSEPALHLHVRSLLLRDISEDSCDVLGIREQADDVDAIVTGEVEPAAREVRDAADTQPIDAAQLAHTRRPSAGHSSDRIQSSHR